MKRLIVVCVLAGCSRAGIAVDEVDAAPGVVMVSPVLDGAVAPDLAQRKPERERCNGADDDLDGKIDEGCPIRLTTDEGQDRSASIEGGRVVWMRFAFEATDLTNEIWMRDLPDGQERLIATGASRAASLSGKRVAFGRGPDVVVLDLESGAETVIMPPVVAYGQTPPSLAGNLVAWAQRNPGDGAWVENDDTYVHDLERKTTIQIAPHPFGQRRPMLEGTRVVWADDRNGHHSTAAFSHLFDLYTADMAANALPVALTHRGYGWTVSMPQAFEGGRVVVYEQDGWDDWMTYQTRGTCGLAIYDVRDGSRREIDPLVLIADSQCNGLSYEKSAALEGKLLVVERDAGRTSELELIDLDSNLRRRVTDYPRRSTHPRLAGGFLVWEDDRNDHWDLYFMDLRDLDEGDFYPEGRAP